MSDLEARIAEVLANHMMRHAGQCVCGWRLTYGSHKPLKTEHEAAREHVTSMLAPVIREREAEAWDACVHAADKQWTIGHTSAQLLRNANPYRSNDE